MGNEFQNLTNSVEYGNLTFVKKMSKDQQDLKLKFEQNLLKEMATFAISQSPLNSISLDVLKERLNKCEDKVNLLNSLKQIAENSYKKEQILYKKILKLGVNEVKCNGYSYMQPREQKDLYLLNFFSDGNITQKIAEEISGKTYIDTFTKAERISGKAYQIYSGENNQPYIEGVSSTEGMKKKPTSTVFKAMSLSGRGGKFVTDLRGKEFSKMLCNAAITIVENLYSEYIIEDGWEEKIRKFMIKEVVLYASKPVLPKSGTADPTRTRKVAYGLKDYDDEQLINLMNSFLIGKVEEIAKSNDISFKTETKQNDDNKSYFRTIFNDAELTLSAKNRIDLQQSINIHLSLTDGSNIKVSHTIATNGKDVSIYQLANNAGKELTEQQLKIFAQDVVKIINDNLMGVKISNTELEKNIIKQIVSLYRQYNDSTKTSTFFQFLFGTAGTLNVKSKVQGTLGEIINSAIIETAIPGAKVEILGQTSNDLAQQAHIDIQVIIDGVTIGIQSKQYNANKLSDTENFYSGDYNIFQKTTQRYFSTISEGGYKIDEKLIELLRSYAYNLILNDKLNGELSNQINEKLGQYFEQFARIADYTNINLSSIKTNFFAYNFALIPVSYIIHSIIEYINNNPNNSSSNLFTITAPEFNFKKKDSSNNDSAGESVEGVQLIDTSSISYQQATQGYTYQIMGTQGIKNLVSNIHFKGLRVSIKNYFVVNKEVN